jgi:ADP-ribose pyrophosphatase YjhB (NUDIX family)
MPAHAHCSFCGEAFTVKEWPRTCARCGEITYLNPIPVCVVLLPVDGGLLLIKRSIPPQVGQWALPGGFLNAGESWQQGGARELFEETGIGVAAESLREVRVVSTPQDRLIVFAETTPVTAASLPAFQASDETSEMMVARAPLELAFDSHTQVMAHWFARVSGPTGGGGR